MTVLGLLTVVGVVYIQPSVCFPVYLLGGTHGIRIRQEAPAIIPAAVERE